MFFKPCPLRCSNIYNAMSVLWFSSHTHLELILFSYAVCHLKGTPIFRPMAFKPSSHAHSKQLSWSNIVHLKATPTLFSMVWKPRPLITALILMCNVYFDEYFLFHIQPRELHRTVLVFFPSPVLHDPSTSPAYLELLSFHIQHVIKKPRPLRATILSIYSINFKDSLYYLWPSNQIAPRNYIINYIIKNIKKVNFLNFIN